MTKIDAAAGLKDDCVQERKRFAPDLPAEVVERLDGLFSAEALDQARVGRCRLPATLVCASLANI